MNVLYNIIINTTLNIKTICSVLAMYYLILSPIASSADSFALGSSPIAFTKSFLSHFSFTSSHVLVNPG